MIKKILIIAIALIVLTNSSSAEEIEWSNTKTIGSSVTITAPQSFTTCEISPDGGSGWDNCTAYVEVFNDLANFNGGNINLNSIWKKGNVRNISYQYTKTITPSNITQDEVITPSRIYSDWQSTVPNVNKGQTVAVKILFEKRTWTTDAFDFSGKFGAYEQILDPEVDACGTLSTDGATYTLNASVTSTGTCFTIGANNITLTSNSSLNQITHSTTTSNTYGIYNNGYDNITLINLNISKTNSSVATSSGIYYYIGDYGNITNNIISSNSNGDGIYLRTDYNIVKNNTISVTAGRGIYILSGYNNILTNNNVTTNPVSGSPSAIYLQTTYNNTFSNSSFINLKSAGNEYNLQANVNTNNTFINTNFTTRKIIFSTGTTFFNYSNNYGVTYISTNVSVAKTIARTLVSWTQTNITWKDNVTVTSASAYYNVTGLLASTSYNVLNNSNIDYTLTTDAGGQLPLFKIDHTTTTRTISVLQDTTPPASITNLANSPTSSSINWTWVNPADSDFNHTEIWLGGVFTTNTSNQFYLYEGLNPSTSYTISTKTSDTSYNVNTTWVNNTATTNPDIFIPPVPTMNVVSTGNFFINQSWSAGVGNISNGYNVSLSNGTWVNGTANYLNNTLSAHARQNITIWAFNASGSGTLSLTSLINNSQIPNNAPVLIAIGNKVVNEGDWLNFSISTSDLDGDSITYATNATKGTLTTNSFSWKPTYSDAGIYQWEFNATDVNGSVDSETILVTVNNMEFLPFSPTNITSLRGSNWVNTSWLSGLNNITNSYNVSVNGAWTNGSANNYTNTTLTSGVYQNVSVHAYNSSGLGTLNNTPATINTLGNNYSFLFSNASSSESQIYAASQATRISIDANDTDGTINRMLVGITYLGVELNYTMEGGNDTWEYNFKTGVTGEYTVTKFYAFDNLTMNNATSSSLAFTVLAQKASGGSGGSSPSPSPTPTKTPYANITPAPDIITTPITPGDVIDEINDNIDRMSDEEKAASLGVIVVGLYLIRPKKKR